MKLQNSIYILIAIVCIGLLPRAQAVVPAPDGGYPGFTTAEGQNALFSVTTGSANTAVGWFSLFSNAEGSFNTATGAGALLFNTADENTAFGAVALLNNATGTQNTAVGATALSNNTTGSYNTASGVGALSANTTGERNTATGFAPLYSNTTGSYNTATGNGALYYNTTGNNNTATGYAALVNNIGWDNTASGRDALKTNTIGERNTATGNRALQLNTWGHNNTAIGYAALVNNAVGNGNTALGVNAGSGVTYSDNVICIGKDVSGANVDNTCFIGNIWGVTPQYFAVPVLIDALGQLGTESSSRRFKKEIKPMHEVSEAILALKPVTFHYKSDKTGTPQFGLIAEDVAAVNPDLVVCDKNGEIYTVRYDAVNAMLLNEFLKAHRKVEEQEASIAQLESAVAQQKSDTSKQESTIGELKKGLEIVVARLKEQDSKIQKVSDQLELSKPALQTVVDNQ